MALTDAQNEFLKLQLANNPEFMAQYFPNVITEGPSGPLYDVDIRRDRPANVFYDQVYDSTALGDMANNIRSPHEPFEPLNLKGAEFRDINVPYDTEGSRLNIIGEPASGIASIMPPSMYYKGKPITGGQTSAIYMHPDIMKSYGTAPSSPRNEMVPTPEWYNKFEKDFGIDVPETMDQAHINDVIESILTHEVGHGVSAKKDYTGISEGATSLDFSKFLPPISELKDTDYNASQYDQEELYNRMKDIEKLKMLSPKDYKNHPLWDLYQRRAKIQFARLTGQKGHLGRLYPAKFKDYQKKIEPYVNAYLKKVGNRGISSINIKKQKIGMPEHLTPPPKKKYVSPPRGGGADVMPVPPSAPISVPVPAHISGAGNKMGMAQGRDRGRARGSGETGQIAGGHHFSRGGLIDIPLTGRSRYI